MYPRASELGKLRVFERPVRGWDADWMMQTSAVTVPHVVESCDAWSAV